MRTITKQKNRADSATIASAQMISFERVRQRTILRIASIIATAAKSGATKTAPIFKSSQLSWIAKKNSKITKTEESTLKKILKSRKI